jgi:transcriptional regulator with XRE-family HTH domain
MKKATKWESIRRKRMGEPGASEAYEDAAFGFAVGEEVRHIREERGLTQIDLARRMGTTQSAIARLEAGGISPTIPTLRKLADALGVELTLKFEEPSSHKRKKKTAAAHNRRRTVAAERSAQKARGATTPRSKTTASTRRSAKES